MKPTLKQRMTSPFTHVWIGLVCAPVAAWAAWYANSHGTAAQTFTACVLCLFYTFGAGYWLGISAERNQK